MKITLICNEYPPLPQGGIGVFTQQYAHGLTRLGHGVTVAGLSSRAMDFKDGAVRVEFVAGDAASLAGRRALHNRLSRDAQDGRTDIIETPEFEGMMPFPFEGCPVAVRLHQSMSGI